MKRVALSIRHQQNLSTFDRCQKSTLRFDLYKQPFRLLLPDEKDTYRTFVGAMLTIFSIILVLVYAGFKVGNLFALDEYKIQVRQKEHLYNEQDKFDYSQGFMVGAAIPEWGKEKRTDIPADIGALKFYKKIWTFKEDLQF